MLVNGMDNVDSSLSVRGHRSSWLRAALEPFVPEPHRLAALAAGFATFVGAITHESREKRPLLHLIAWAGPMLLVAVLAAVVASAVATAVHRRIPTTLGWAVPFYTVHAAASCIAVPLLTLNSVHIEGEPNVTDPWLFVFVGAGLVGFALMLNIWGVLDARCETQADELEAREALVDAAHEMLVVTEEGIRREVAEVLHGRVQSRLLALELKLGRLAEELPAMEGASIHEITEHLRSLREDDVRRLSHSLHPTALRLGLLPALHELVAHAEQGLGMRAQLQVQRTIVELDRPGGRGLPDAARLTIYRAVEEAIVNAQRHGAAQQVDIELRLVADDVVLSVRDNGCGAPPDIPAGFGLTQLELRVGAQGGSMALEHNVDGGMTLRLSLPLASGGDDDVAPEFPAVVARRSVQGRGRVRADATVR